MRFTFFHAADLHLGAASEGVMKGAPKAVREAVETSTYRAFDKLIRDAEHEKPAFVLFPGDIYNTADENLRARLAFRDGIVRLDRAGIQSFVIRGNHDYDRGKDSLRLPDSCHVFKPDSSEPVLAYYQGQPIARIFGQSYPTGRVTKNLAAGYLVAECGEGGLLQIAMLHGNLEGEKRQASGEKNASDYAPFRRETLLERGYDYWALGHVHTADTLLTGPHWAAYSGSLQGISPRETGPKGYLCVTVEDCRVMPPSFREADVLRWDDVRIDLTGARLYNEMEARVETAVRASLKSAGGKPVVARLRLVGTTPLNEELRSEDFEDGVPSLRDGYALEQPFFWIDEISVETRAEIDWDAIRHSHSLPGFLLELSEGGNSAFNDATPARLRAAMGKTKFDLPPDEDLAELLRRAGERAVSLLNLGGGN